MHHAWIPEFWMTIPFIGLLLSLAIMPLVAGKFWSSLKNQSAIALLFSLPVIFLCWKHAPHLLKESLQDYVSFVILLASLFIASGGIWLAGGLKNTPAANTFLLATGAVLCNFIGTTGASMVLIRPLLHANAHRKHHAHLPLFFIFLVSNIGGLLTPLGDPPLFLGFLNGVPFFWTLKLFPEWIMAVTILLAVFYLTDRTLLARDKPLGGQAFNDCLSPKEPLKLKGKRNILCFAMIITAIFMPAPYREIIMIVAAFISLRITPAAYHKENGFHLYPIYEVAIIFLGIFITMVPALELLRTRGGELGITLPWQFFWATGSFSSFLDNAPTYLTFVALGQGLGSGGPYWSMPENLLRAISVGAVFFGAMTYIGNAPNFMVRSIASRSGWKMPSFFGYMLWSVGILLPLFLLITFLFFR